MGSHSITTHSQTLHTYVHYHPTHTLTTSLLSHTHTFTHYHLLPTHSLTTNPIPPTYLHTYHTLTTLLPTHSPLTHLTHPTPNTPPTYHPLTTHPFNTPYPHTSPTYHPLTTHPFNTPYPPYSTHLPTHSPLTHLTHPTPQYSTHLPPSYQHTYHSPTPLQNVPPSTHSLTGHGREVYPPVIER